MLIKGSFEDFLYIIIGLIWVAFSIYKGTQKKKSVARRDAGDKSNEIPPEEKKKSFFDEFLNQIVTEEEPLPYEPVTSETSYSEPYSEEKEEEKEEKVFSYDDFVEESNYKEENDVYDFKPAIEADVKDELKSHLKSTNDHSRFDLKKAIIYSEILNRRYF